MQLGTSYTPIIILWQNIDKYKVPFCIFLSICSLKLSSLVNVFPTNWSVSDSTSIVTLYTSVDLEKGFLFLAFRRLHFYYGTCQEIFLMMHIVYSISEFR